MELTVNQKRKFKQGITFLILGTILGPLYALLSDGFESIHPYITGVLLAFSLALMFTTFELYVFKGQIRRRRFSVVFLIRSMVYLVLVVGLSYNAFAISRMIRFKLSYFDVLESDEFKHYVWQEDYFLVVLFALFFIVLTNFTRQLSRKLGQGVLLSYITGKYMIPREEDRIVMFLSVANGRTVVDDIGDYKYHGFMNDFIFDITESIVIHSGIIHHYIEDTIVVSWAMEKGVTDANCVRTFFHLTEEIEDRREYYFQSYGHIPVVHGAFHAGSVIKAEVGYVKSEISYFGDTLNTTSRILGKCEESGYNLLLSQGIKELVQLPVIYQYAEAGSFVLKGKEAPHVLYTIKDLTDDQG